MRRRKPNPLKILKRKTWEVFARYIRQRDAWCVTCLMLGKKTPTTDAGHYRHNSERSASLGGNALWYDERAINGQCAKCNRFQAGRLDLYAIFLEKKYGHGILQELNTLWLSPKKWVREEIEAIRLKYEEEVLRLS